VKNNTSNIKWPFISNARHKKIVQELIADYENELKKSDEAALNADTRVAVLTKDLDAAHKQLCESSSQFPRFCLDMTAWHAHIEFVKTPYNDHFYVLSFTPDLVKERGTTDFSMSGFYDSVKGILPDDWQWAGNMTFSKKFFGDDLINASEIMVSLTKFLQGELDALYATIRRTCAAGIITAVKKDVAK
jgi:hypothetical protein